MPASTFASSVLALARARRKGTLAVLADGWAPTGLDEAYRMQADVVELLGDVRGWKVSGLTAEQQGAMSVAGPVAAPLIAPWFADSGASFALDAFAKPPLLECEFAFMLGTDLPPRTPPYHRDEVEAAITAMHPAIEICDSRLAVPGSTLQQVADGFNNGAFVLGPAWAGWRSVDYAHSIVALRQAGRPEALETGSGAAILGGDPVGAVVAMANLQAPPRRGLRAGDVVTTGSCTRPRVVLNGGEFTGDFGPFGHVVVHLAGTRS